MSIPFFTVIMPIRNEAEFIRRSLNTVLAQGYPAECMEIFVAGRCAHGRTMRQYPRAPTDWNANS